MDEEGYEAIPTTAFRTADVQDVVFDGPLALEVLIRPHAGAAECPPDAAGFAAQNLGDGSSRRGPLGSLGVARRHAERLDRAHSLIEDVLASQLASQEGARLTDCASAVGDPCVTHKRNLFLWYRARQL